SHDTLLDLSGAHYFYQCYIPGSIDFSFWTVVREYKCKGRGDDLRRQVPWAISFRDFTKKKYIYHSEMRKRDHFWTGTLLTEADGYNCSLFFMVSH
ncbi:hypothetical protein IFM89_020076, partial [Coptis chinensis]